jgi:hypothetical protein
MGKSARFAVEFDTMKEPRKNVEPDDQGKMFIDAARELGCDESEEKFDAALKKVAQHKGGNQASAPASNKPKKEGR